MPGPSSASLVVGPVLTSSGKNKLSQPILIQLDGPISESKRHWAVYQFYNRIPQLMPMIVSRVDGDLLDTATIDPSMLPATAVAVFQEFYESNSSIFS